LHFHKYPEENYRYLREGNCVQQARCSHGTCAHGSDHRERHVPAEIQWGPLPCEYTQRCNRCDQMLAHATQHDWGSWMFDHDNTCTIIRRCKRHGCKEEQHGTTHIATDAPRFLTTTSCDLIATCQRCNENILLHTASHAYAPRYLDNTTCMIASVCVRCGQHEDIISASIRQFLDNDQLHVFTPDTGTCMRCQYTKTKQSATRND
jgi:hypothetical protein